MLLFWTRMWYFVSIIHIWKYLPLFGYIWHYWTMFTILHAYLPLKAIFCLHLSILSPYFIIFTGVRVTYFFVTELAVFLAHMNTIIMWNVCFCEKSAIRCGALFKSSNLTNQALPLTYVAMFRLIIMWLILVDILNIGVKLTKLYKQANFN